MQTFLTTFDPNDRLGSYITTFTQLDPKRRNNQVCREGITLLRGKWPNHPAAKLWAPYREELAVYLLAGLVVLYAQSRSSKYLDRPWASEILDAAKHAAATGASGRRYPPVFDNPRFCAGHRAALLAKDPDWYSRFGWTETPEPDTKRAYIWE